MYRVKDFYEQHAKKLYLKVLVGESGFTRNIRKPEVTRPGLSLAGFFANFSSYRIFIFGRMEILYLRQLDRKTRMERLNHILTSKTPAVIIARNFRPPKDLKEICRKKEVPLFSSSLETMALLSKVIFLLNEEFSPSITLHATLVEVFGVGVLLQGKSSIGKSEAALGLLERGHRLISDDIVLLKKKEGEGFLMGQGPELTRHIMEIRGIGIINVAHLYGAVCVRPNKRVELSIHLEEWDDTHFYDRVGLEEKKTEILGITIPYHILPVKPGRDVILLIETIALNHRLKEMGYHSAKEFNAQLLETIKGKHGRKARAKSEA